METGANRIGQKTQTLIFAQGQFVHFKKRMCKILHQVKEKAAKGKHFQCHPNNPGLPLVKEEDRLFLKSTFFRRVGHRKSDWYRVQQQCFSYSRMQHSNSRATLPHKYTLAHLSCSLHTQWAAVWMDDTCIREEGGTQIGFVSGKRLWGGIESINRIV